MPMELSCPKCTHVFPVTEARHPVGVQCPGCDVDLTAEFRKPAGPAEPGKPPYELLVSVGKPPGAVATAEAKAKMRLDDEEEKKRQGGSMMIVLVAGLGALLVALGGLGTTGYFLFTNLDTSDATINKINQGNPGGNKGNPGGNKGNPGGNPVGNKGGTNPGGPPTENPPPPKKIETFELKPVLGPLPTIAPPSIDLSTPHPVLLPGKAGAISVGGGGRYIVMHFPQQGRLSVFDVNVGDFTANEGLPNGDAHVAAGASKVIVTAPGNKLQVYSLPELKKENSFGHPLAHGVYRMAMGSRTNGPLLVVDVFGKYALMDVAAGKPIEATEGNGLPHEMVRAMPDGKLFLVANGTTPRDKTSLLDENGRKWRLRSPDVAVSFPGPDSRHLFGMGQIMTTDGRPVSGKGAAVGNVWYVPAVTSTGNYFLKVVESKGAGPGKRSGLTISIHKDLRNVDKSVLPVFQDLPETERFMDLPFGRAPEFDQHLFLIPEARLFAIIDVDKTKMILRQVNLK